MNDSNSTLSEDGQLVNILVACSIGIFALSGCIAYSIVVIIIVFHPKFFSNNSYYTLLLSLAFSEMAELVQSVFYLPLCIISQSRIFGDEFDIIYNSFSTILCYYAGLAVIVLIAINRYYAVCNFTQYPHIFSKNRTRMYLAIAWVWGVLSGSVQLLPMFGFRFYYDIYTWGYNDTEGNVYFAWYDRGVSIFVLITTLFCYIAILRKRPMQIGKGNINTSGISTIKRHTVERNLALQFGIVALFFVLYEVNFAVSTIFWVENRFFYFFLTILYNAFVSCNPYVYLTFNSDVRSHFSRIFCKCHHTKVSAVSAVPVPAVSVK
jgi:hypothetical protein